jgi:hypothetical protein
MDKIKLFLSSRLASLVFITIAIVSRIINVLFVSYTGRDKMLLVMQSKSFLEGKGLGVAGYFTSNPETVVYDYTPHWPPGYPILLAPFLKIFNYDIYWATTVFDIIACIALIFVVRKICRQMSFPITAINIMTLIVGCFEYTFINDSKPTDNVPIVMFLLGISLVIATLMSDRFSFKAVIIGAFVLFVPGLFRYSYPPLTIAVTVSILLFGILKRDRLLKKKGAWLLGITLLLTITFLVIMKLTTGYAGYAVPSARGYFPGNLVHWFPIVPASFMNLAFLTSQTRHVAGLSFTLTMQLLEIINVISILSIVIFFLLMFFSKRFYTVLTPFKWFLIIGFFASAAIFVSLGYLSFTYQMQGSMTNAWTYVSDHRYYAFTVLFLQISFLGWIFLYKTSLKNYFLKAIAIICGLFLFIEVTHNIYFHTKVAFNFKKYKSEVFREQDYDYFFKLMDDLENKYPGYDIWSAASGDDFYPYTATYFGYKGIMDAASFKDNIIKVKKKTILTFLLYDHDIPAYNDFLSRSKIEFINKIDNSNYYIIELLP